MAIMDFDAMATEASKQKKEFRLGGQTWTARAKLPWRAMTKLMTGIDPEHPDRGVILKIDEFFETVLVRDDRPRFAEMINAEDPDDEDAIVSVEEIQQVMTWLMGQYTGKAEELSESSGDTPEVTGLPSKVVSLGSRSASATA